MTQMYALAQPSGSVLAAGGAFTSGFSGRGIYRWMNSWANSSRPAVSPTPAASPPPASTDISAFLTAWLAALDGAC